MLLSILLLSSACGLFGLTVGDPAPPLKVETMLKGEAVDLSKGMHVVEFWATWCGPCQESIPHLSEMARTYRGKVDFTGVDVWETADDKLRQVKKYVDFIGDKMDYNLALDGDAGVMAKSFLEAAKQNSIPTAFLVKDGVILWIGHPKAGLDTAIDQVLAGKFDLAASKAAFEPEFAKQVAYEAVEEAMNANNYSAALAAIDKAMASYPKARQDFAFWRLKSIVMTDSPEVKATAQKFLEGEVGDNAEKMNYLAWMIVTPKEKVPNPDYQIALRLAERITKATGMKNGEYLDTYARALFLTGDKQKALDVQKQAVEMFKTDPNPREDELKNMEGRLEEYREANG